MKIHELKYPVQVESETIKDVELCAPSKRSKGVSAACSKMAGFVIGAESRAQLEMVKAVQGIDFGAVDKTAATVELSDADAAKQLISRCCMSDANFTSELVERFTEVFKNSPNVVTYLGAPISNETFEQLHWKDLETIAAVYAINFMLS
jgi:hypothetical protein